MPTPQQEKILTPELIRILKIFGIGSVLLVLVLSFFNERRANNSGEEPSPMRITDADRIYFKNIRSINYDLEHLREAKMLAYRHSKRPENPGIADLPVAILLNITKDEAYLYWEFPNDSLPIVLNWNRPTTGESGEVRFEGGDKFAHLAFGEKVFPLIANDEVTFELNVDNKKREVLNSEEDRAPLLTILKDYFKLINKTGE